jgi:DNA-binding LacI/PurR family transcriptional regulator
MPRTKRHPGSRPTLRDVARRAGVSLGTASNAFSRPELLSPALRHRVLAASQSLRYPGPDPAARRLSTGRTGVIGLIFTEQLPFAFADPAAPLFLGGIACAIEDARAGLLIVPTSPSRADAAKVVRDAAVDGFILYSTPNGDPRVEAALERRLPLVAVDQPRGLPYPFIGIDDRSAAQGAAEHVRRLGHRRVLILSLAEAVDSAGRLDFDLTRERLAGYRDGLGEAWAHTRVEVCLPNRIARARELVLDLLEGDEPPTAILAMSDAIAVGALQAAQGSGIPVPDELSIVGFDDSPAAALTVPPLTSVAQPHERKGQLAAELLLAEIDRSDAIHPPQQRILPADLVIRASTAPAP